jgi:hypothetical protein
MVIVVLLAIVQVCSIVYTCTHTRFWPFRKGRIERIATLSNHDVGRQIDGCLTGFLAIT